eukprot:500143_1
MDHIKPDTLQQLLDDGLEIEAAVNIIQASNDLDTQIQCDDQNNETRDIYLCAQDRKLLLKILANVNDYPNNQKYKSINVGKITEKAENYEKFMDILNRAGFNKWSHDGSRLAFDTEQYDTLQSVYFNILSMEIYDDNQYVYDSPQSSNETHLNHLLQPHQPKTRNACDLSSCSSLNNIGNILLFYNSHIEGITELNDEKKK